MKKSVATLILLPVCGMLFGQTLDTESASAVEWDETRAMISDDYIFYTPVWEAPDPFRSLSRFRFGAVRYRERGLDDRFRRVFIGGISLSDNISPYPDYTLISLLWRTSFAKGTTPAFVAGNGYGGGLGYAEHYSPKASVAAGGLSVTVRAAGSGYRAGVDAGGKTDIGNGWDGSFGISGRMGPDGYIAGVRSNGAGGAVSATKTWNGGSSLTLLAMGNHTVGGIRSAAVREAFELTGDRLYNPSWGRQDGRVRNSRERRNSHAMTLAMFETTLGDRSVMTVSAGFRWGRGGYTALAWYDTHSPAPDYYRKMPSYFPEWNAAGVIADAWRQEDETVTQIDWDALYYANTLVGGHSTYILEERVERIRNASANVRIDRKFAGGLNVSYGIGLTRARSRYFKEAADLLGGEYVYNIDQYATDFDGEYRVGAGNDNDLRNPGRQVREGDRFGYDYAITRLTPMVFGIVRRDTPRWGVAASAEFGHTMLRRQGFYEKELFSGGASFGKSPQAAFTTYSLGASAYWNISLRHRFSLSALASSEAPFAENIFISPTQNNILITSPSATGIYGAEASWSFGGKGVDVRVTGFLNSITDETEIRNYYDDLAAVFANMAVRGIDKLFYGVEAGLEARFTRRLSLTAGVSAADYRYGSDPVAAVYADIDNSVVSEGIVCRMRGLKTGAPQTVAAADLTYADSRGWRVSLGAEYMGGRRVAINPLYHGSRVAGINAAPEIMERFTSQERLPDAFTLGMSASKGFVLRRGYLLVRISVHNILSADIIYSGYEQMRILRSGSGINRTLVPFPSKYMYSWPATWNFSVSYSL